MTTAGQHSGEAQKGAGPVVSIAKRGDDVDGHHSMGIFDFRSALRGSKPKRTSTTVLDPLHGFIVASR